MWSWGVGMEIGGLVILREKFLLLNWFVYPAIGG